MTRAEKRYVLAMIGLCLLAMAGLCIWSDNGNGDRPKAKELVVVSPGADKTNCDPGHGTGTDHGNVTVAGDNNCVDMGKNNKIIMRKPEGADSPAEQMDGHKR